MKRLRIILSAMLLGIFAGLAPPGSADDTELYRGQVTEVGENARPNILFVLDRSGSMSWREYDENGDALYGGTTRMERLKEALGMLLDEVHNVNVGFASFTNGGSGDAAIMFPISYIDDPVAEVPGEKDFLSVLDYQVSESADDAEEGLSSNEMYLDHETIQMTEFDETAPQGAGITVPIVDGWDNARQFLGGGSQDRGDVVPNSILGASGWGMGLVGLRFENVMIPKGSIILKAQLVFTAHSDVRSGDLELTISGVDQDDPPRIENKDRDISNSWSTLTDNLVTWQVPEWEADMEFPSPDLTSIVQEIVDADHWDGTGMDDIAFRLVPSSNHPAQEVYDDVPDDGRRYVEYGDDPNRAIKLRILYDASDANQFTSVTENDAYDDAYEYVGDGDGSRSQGHMIDNNGGAGINLGHYLTDEDRGHVIMGTRFSNLEIPQGAVIDQAWISFAVKNYENRSDDDLDVKIVAQDSVSAPAFSGSNGNITNRLLVKDADDNPLEVAWDDVPPTPRYEMVATPDISSLLQPLVENPAWNETSNAVAFAFHHVDGNGARRYYARESSTSYPERYPTLHVLWNYPEGAGGGGEPSQSSEEQLVGLRFQEVAIPQGVEIKEAYLEFTSGLDATETAKVKIFGEASGDSQPFSETATISGRSKTGASVSWDVPAWHWGVTYKSPDLSEVIEAVVKRSDWCGKNDMSFIIEAEEGSPLRNFLSHDNDPAYAPRLYVEYDIVSLNNLIESGQGTCIPTTWSAQINDGLNDAEEVLRQGTTADGTMFLDSSTLEITTTPETGGDSERMVGLRFTDVPIHPATTILKAELLFTGVEPDTASLQEATEQVATLKIQGQLGSAQEFGTADNDLSSTAMRPKSNAQTWELPADEPWQEDELYTSVDISQVVQEVVNAGGWEAFGDMALFITGEGLRQAAAFERGATKAPILRVEINGMLAQEGSPGYYTTVRQKLKQQLEQISPRGSTPLVDTIYEVARYWHGKSVDVALSRGGDRNKLVSHPGSWEGGEHYIPPGCPGGVLGEDIFHSSCSAEKIEGEPTYVPPTYNYCQGNHIVFLTDGTANGVMNSTKTSIRNMTDNSSCRGEFSAEVEAMAKAEWNQDSYPFDPDFEWDEECGPEVVKWLAETDVDPWLNGVQNVITHAVGFNLGVYYKSDGSVDEDKTQQNSRAKPYLQEWVHAQGGNGGDFYAAASAEELLNAFRTIVAAALTQSTSFAAPSLSVNAFSKLYHNDEVYFSLFKPDNTVAWQGNVKKFKVCTANGQGACTQELDEHGNLRDLGKILDRNNELAMDPQTDKLSENAFGSWNASEDPDGGVVTKKGAGGQIPAPDSRNIYTNLSGSTLSEVSTSNSSLVDHLRNTVGVAEPEKLIHWIRGYRDGDPSGTVRDWRMGDPLHSSPGVVTYTWEGDADSAPTRIFIATNEGSIRMLDSETGEELWMFIPKEMLAIQRELMKNDIRYNRVYGIDGTPAFLVDPSAGKAQMFIGMRRGGRNVYALDVSDSSAQPSLMWTIKGGEGNFNSLGQTWSTPKPAYVPFHDTPVLVFGGGYDAETQDSLEAFNPADFGNAVYIVEAASGNRLWWASDSGANLNLPNMQYAVPSDLQLMDSDGDGKSDRLYFGDTGGQVWRIDLAASAGDSVGGLLAGLSDSTESSKKRRFFYPPDVVRLRDYEYSPDNPIYDLILIGSGHRPKPLGTQVHDTFYALRDYAVNGLVDDDNNGIADYQDSKEDAEDNNTLFYTLSHDDLYDATLNVLQESTEGEVLLEDKEELQESHGWYINLMDQENDPPRYVGEKVLASPIVLEGKVFFTTFLPPLGEDEMEVPEDACAISSEGRGRLYALDILTAGAGMNLNEENDGDDGGGNGEDGTVLDSTDRSQIIGQGIPSGALPVFLREGVSLLVGSGGGIFRLDDVLGIPRQQVYWSQE